MDPNLFPKLNAITFFLDKSWGNREHSITHIFPPEVDKHCPIVPTGGLRGPPTTRLGPYNHGRVSNVSVSVVPCSKYWNRRCDKKLFCGVWTQFFSSIAGSAIEEFWSVLVYMWVWSWVHIFVLDFPFCPSKSFISIKFFISIFLILIRSISHPSWIGEKTPNRAVTMWRTSSAVVGVGTILCRRNSMWNSSSFCCGHVASPGFRNDHVSSRLLAHVSSN